MCGRVSILKIKVPSLEDPTMPEAQTPCQDGNRDQSLGALKKFKNIPNMAKYNIWGAYLATPNMIK